MKPNWYNSNRDTNINLLPYCWICTIGFFLIQITDIYPKTWSVRYLWWEVPNFKTRLGPDSWYSRRNCETKSFWRTYRSKNFIWNIYYNYFIIINLQFNIFYNINFPIINFWFFIITFYKTPLCFKATTVLISSPFNLIKTKKFATKKYFFVLAG